MATKVDAWLDPDGRFIYQRIDGDMDDREFALLDQKTVELAAKLRDPDCVLILFDGRRAGKASFKARRAMIESLTRPKLRRLAVFGAKPMGRLIMRFILTVSGEKKIRAFETEADAKHWLLS